MRHHQQVFANVRKLTGMYFHEETYAAVAAFVLGYDQACEGGVLVGFQEWLATRLTTGSNIGWPVLVLDAAFPREKFPRDAVHASAQAERHAIETLFDLLDEFEKARSRHAGLQEIFLAHQRWMQSELQDD